MRTRTTWLVAGGLALLMGCSGSGGGSVEYYFVSYADASAYKGEADEAALDRCGALDGATRRGQDDTYPPSGITVTFDGPEDGRTRLENCLRSLPNVRVIGPAKEGDLKPPQLVG